MMEDWGVAERMRFGVVRATALAMVAAGLECIALAAGLQLDLSLLDFVMLGAAATLGMGALTLVFSVVCAPIFAVMREARASQALAAHFALVAFLLCGFYLWIEAWSVYSDGRAIPALAMAAMPLGFGGVAYFNAVFWLRRLEIGAPQRVGWLAVASAFGALAILGSALAYQARDTGGAYALGTDQNVVVVTIDGLRRDRVGVLGGADTPHIDRIGEVVFADTVSPTTSLTGAHATMFTGLHPLRHEVLRDGQRLGRQYTTVAERLAKEGFATGAFVSSFRVGTRSGLQQGFRTFDDDYTPIPAVAHLRLGRVLIGGWLSVGDPASTPWLYQRPAHRSVDRFTQWLDRHRDVPFFGWVQLGAPDDGDYGAWVAQADSEVGRIRTALEGAGVWDETLVIVVGDRGHMLGEHGLHGQIGLFDPVVRVPMVVHAPGAKVAVPQVTAQVRLMDLASTIMSFLGMDAPDDSEGIDLFGYVSGKRKAPLWCGLVGHHDGSVLLGLRNNGVKYVHDLDSGTEQLFDLNEDPEETHDLSVAQPATLAQARRLVAADTKALKRLSK